MRAAEALCTQNITIKYGPFSMKECVDHDGNKYLNTKNWSINAIEPMSKNCLH